MTIEILSDSPLGSILTSRIITIATATTLIIITSGCRAMEIRNCGPTDMFYGDSAVAANSGNAIWVDGYHFWDHIVSNFNVYCIANSAATKVVTNEYE